ncbi:hypothetical protein Tco_0492703 [Tanacetum coccineum]
MIAAKGAPVKRKPLNHTDYEVDLESRPTATGAVFQCFQRNSSGIIMFSIDDCLPQFFLNVQSVEGRLIPFKANLQKATQELTSSTKVPPAELEQYLQSVPKVTDAAVIPNSSFSNIVHRGEGGESSFSVACPSLGLITYCKPIGCYGDILLHSSSSTLNTRSSLCRPFFLQDKKQLGDLNFIYCIHHLIPIPSSSEFCGQTD